MTELTPELKKLLILFHNGRRTMKEVGLSMGLTADEANKVYMNSIAGIIKESISTYDIAFHDEVEEPAEPEEPEEPEAPEEPARPEVLLDDAFLSLPEGKPVVIEAGDYALDVASKLTDQDGIPTLDSATAELPGIAIATKAVILDIDRPFVYVKPAFDAEKNIVSATFKEF